MRSKNKPICNCTLSQDRQLREELPYLIRSGQSQMGEQINDTSDSAELVMSVVVQFYSWFQFYFLLFETCYYKLPHSRTNFKANEL